MVRMLIGWLLNAMALLAVAYLLPSIHVASFGSALIAALVLGLVNTLIRPMLVMLTLPVTLLTLGLFLLVINGLLFWAVGNMLDGFSVGGFWSGVFGALLYSLISWLLGGLLQAEGNEVLPSPQLASGAASPRRGRAPGRPSRRPARRPVAGRARPRAFAHGGAAVDRGRARLLVRRADRQGVAGPAAHRRN